MARLVRGGRHRARSRHSPRAPRGPGRHLPVRHRGTGSRHGAIPVRPGIHRQRPVGGALHAGVAASDRLPPGLPSRASRAGEDRGLSQMACRGAAHARPGALAGIARRGRLRPLSLLAVFRSLIGEIRTNRVVTARANP
ncbi:hypothetical protein VARIO8X_50377 [Burkholderiales bacterium 8X]|nr:hypothetical protein VARIO8X_50377 [Burkholderiales bacterium 8X]